MAEIKTFKALCYAKGIALEKVVCPPYDVINHIQRQEYIKKSPYNIVKIELPDRNSLGVDYRKAGYDLLSWIEKGVLRHDEKPCFYVYAQECLAHKEKIVRYGFFSLLCLKHTGPDNVLPHENVFSKPLLDRASLMKSTRAHISPIFIVFDDKKARVNDILKSVVKSRPPDFNIYADKARHKLWRITDNKLIEKITHCLGKAQTFIADGHHRYQASLKAGNYFKNKKVDSNGHEYTLAYLVSSKDKGLRILPTHRGVKILPAGFDLDYLEQRVKKYFDMTFISKSRVDACLKRNFHKGKCAFVFYYKNKFILLSLKNNCLVKHIGPKNSSLAWKSLDVSVLHNLLFKKLLKIKEKTDHGRNIYYYKEKEELISRVDDNSHALGVFMNASTMDDVIKLARNNEKMPHKSTYFYPKPLTGLVIHKF